MALCGTDVVPDVVKVSNGLRSSRFQMALCHCKGSKWPHVVVKVTNGSMWYRRFTRRCEGLKWFYNVSKRIDYEFWNFYRIFSTLTPSLRCHTVLKHCKIQPISDKSNQPYFQE